MSLAEEMLAKMPLSTSYTPYIGEEEDHIVINESRTAIVPSELMTIAVTGDKDIETIHFDCVRYWDGYDLSTFAIFLNYVLPDMTTGTYIPKSITTSEGDRFYHFDWLIEKNITQKSGKISFAVTAVKTKQNEGGETVVDKQWSSLPNGDCSIALGLNIENVPDNEETQNILSQMSAILEQMQSDIDNFIKNIVVQNIGYSENLVMSQKAVTDIIAPITVIEETREKVSAEIVSGFYNANSGVFSSYKGYKTFKFPYDGTSKVIVTTYVLANVVAVACFYDENDAFIRSSGIETETKWITDHELTIPENTAYIAINCRYTGTEEPSAFVVKGIKNVSVNPDKIPLYNETVNAVSAVTVKGYDGEKISAEIVRGLYSGSSGSFTENNGYKAMKFPYDGTSKINVTTYVLANVVAVACFYDSSDTFIGSTGVETETKWINDFALPIPANTAYIAVNCRYTGAEEPTAYKVISENTYCDYSKMLHGKKIVNFGDSIFGNYRDTNPSDKSISVFIAEKTGAVVYNGGFGGCRMANHSQYWNDFSMDSLADAIASGDWKPQETAIANQSALPTYFSDTVEMLKGIDWNNIDVITIGYGTNDYTGDVTLDDFKESLRYSVRTILTAYPHLQILVVSPMWRWFISGGSYSHNSDDEASKNANGNMLPDFVTACEEVAKEYHIPYLDTYYDMGINRYNYLRYFASTDGTHPNINGREIRARYISNRLLQIL